MKSSNRSVRPGIERWLNEIEIVGRIFHTLERTISRVDSSVEDDCRETLDSNIEFRENGPLTESKPWWCSVMMPCITLSIRRAVVRGLLQSISCSLQRSSKNLFVAKNETFRSLERSDSCRRRYRQWSVQWRVETWRQSLSPDRRWDRAVWTAV